MSISPHYPRQSLPYRLPDNNSECIHCFPAHNTRSVTSQNPAAQQHKIFRSSDSSSTSYPKPDEAVTHPLFSKSILILSLYVSRNCVRTCLCVIFSDWLRPFVVSRSMRSLGFDPRPLHFGFVVDKVTLGQVFLRTHQLYPASIIPPVLHTD